MATLTDSELPHDWLALCISEDLHPSFTFSFFPAGGSSPLSVRARGPKHKNRKPLQSIKPTLQSLRQILAVFSKWKAVLECALYFPPWEADVLAVVLVEVDFFGGVGEVGAPVRGGVAFRLVRFVMEGLRGG